MSYKSIEVRVESKSTAIMQAVEVQVPTNKFAPNGDGTFSPVMEMIQQQQIVGHEQSEIKVIGVKFDDSARETYYEAEYADLAQDIGTHDALLVATLAGWAVPE